MGYLMKLVITLIVMVLTCVAAWYVPSWAWTFGWIGASMCSIFLPSQWQGQGSSEPAIDPLLAEIIALRADLAARAQAQADASASVWAASSKGYSFIEREADASIARLNAHNLT